MKKSSLQSLRLGFSTQEAEKIERIGIDNFIQLQLQANIDLQEPVFFRKYAKKLIRTARI